MAVRWREASGAPASVCLDTPVGRLRLSARGAVLVAIDWDAAGETGAAPAPVLADACAALQRYFQCPLAPLSDLPLHPGGTAYQRRVWQHLAAIPPGETQTYATVAQALDSGARAVAAACRANPYPLVIPCHRVVAAHGLGGYCGAADGPWLAVKRWLLDHEQQGAARD